MFSFRRQRDAILGKTCAMLPTLILNLLNLALATAYLGIASASMGARVMAKRFSSTFRWMRLHLQSWTRSQINLLSLIWYRARMLRKNCSRWSDRLKGVPLRAYDDHSYKPHYFSLHQARRVQIYLFWREILGISCWKVEISIHFIARYFILRQDPI